MRTISGTVSTREEAEAARRRLEALGIDGGSILFKEVGEPGPGSIFVTVKAAPEQVEAASDILRGGGARARQPLPVAEPLPEPQPEPQRFERRPSDAPPPPPAVDRPAAAPVERVERRMDGPNAHSRPVPAKDRQPSSVRLARMAAIAALLAGLGFAIGAAFGILA